MLNYKLRQQITEHPIGTLNLRYCGKLGAGLPDLKSAIKYLQNPKERYSFFNPLRPEGAFINSGNQPDGVWEIHPDGAYHSIYFVPEFTAKKQSEKLISVYKKTIKNPKCQRSPLDPLKGKSEVHSELAIPFRGIKGVRVG